MALGHTITSRFYWHIAAWWNWGHSAVLVFRQWCFSLLWLYSTNLDFKQNNDSEVNMLTFSYQDVHIHCVSSVRNLPSHSSIWNASYFFCVCLFVPSMVPFWKVTSMAHINAQLRVIIVSLKQNWRPGSRSPIQQSTRVHWLVWGWKDNPFVNFIIEHLYKIWHHFWLCRCCASLSTKQNEGLSPL